MADPIGAILAAANHDGAMLDAADLSRMPDGVMTWLKRSKVLVPAAPAKHVRCTLCEDDHLVPVEAVKQGSENRLLAVCGESGLFAVSEDALRRWRVEVEAFISAIAQSICGCASVQRLVEQRAWRLGTCSLDGVGRPVLLFRGFGRSDSAEIQRQATRSIAADHAIALTLDVLEECGPSAVSFAAILSVQGVVTISERGLKCDAGRLEEALPRAAEVSDKPSVDRKTLTVRYKHKVCQFTSRSKTLLSLLVRISMRPGQRVSYDALRAEVFGDELLDDVSIRSSATRLRDRLRSSGMEELAECIVTDSVDGGALMLDLARYGRPPKSN